MMELTAIKGIGPKKAQALAGLGIENVRDLLNYAPRLYEDRRVCAFLSEVRSDKASVRLKVISEPRTRYLGRRKNITSMVTTDGVEECEIAWFGQPYRANQFKAGESHIFFGKLEKQRCYKMLNPKIEKAEDLSGFTPVYPLTRGISNDELRAFIKGAWLLEKDVLYDPLPEGLRAEKGLLSYKDALSAIHFPKDYAHAQEGRKALAFKEVYTSWLLRIEDQTKQDKEPGRVLDARYQLEKAVKDLPYTLTRGQASALKDILKDMAKPHPMNRLLQGDVGSGKTAVAILAALNGALAGVQVAFMAPTLLVAEQHYMNWKDFLSDQGISSGCLTGTTSAKERAKLLEGFANGQIRIVFGTHALIEDAVEFSDLGLVITDEQHRFGVRQRGRLTEKGDRTDMLVLSATPIPRTLSLIYYGDLKLSTIYGLPPGRQAIETYVVTELMEGRFAKFVLNLINEGRQAYVVSPMIEEGDAPIASVEHLIKRMAHLFPKKQVKALHGKLKNAEKTSIMEAFRQGQIDVLVSTTVIEVGVDVPNASVMIIYNAERFGLAQLHQLRGRIGRGQHASYCILVTNTDDASAIQRLRVMEETQDGFEIAEKDLRFRGGGDTYGVRQSGVPLLKWADPARDAALLADARKAAEETIRQGHLEREEYGALKSLLSDLRRRRDGIVMN